MTDIFKGATDQSRQFELVDSTTGLPKTGIVYTDVTGSYSRTRSARVAITMATLASASAAHADGGFILIDDTNQPGIYRFDIPDAAFATGAEEVVITVKATGCRTVSRQFNLVNINNQVAYVPNAAADAAGGLPISDAGGLDLDSKLANTNEVTAARMGALTDWINGGRLDLILDIIAADTTTDIPTLIAALNDISTVEVNGVLEAYRTNGVASDNDAQSILAGNVQINGVVDSIYLDTVNIGTNGAGLNSIPWNAAWDAEVESECTDALAAYDPPTRAELTTDTNSVLTAVGDVPTNAELASALGTGTWATAIPWNAAWDAEVQSEVQDAIEANHLDHLLAVEYDPASKPGVVAALLNELIGNDSGVSQFTANALELGPSGSGGGGGGGGGAIVERSTSDNRPITFTFPASGATLTGVVSINNGVDTAVAGALDFYRTEENGKHWYTLAYNAADRPASEGTARYIFTNTTYTVYVTLRVVDAGASAAAVAAIPAAILGYDWTTFVGDPPSRSVLNALRHIRNKWIIAGTTKSVMKEDDVSVAYTTSITADSNGNITADTPN